MSDTCHGCRWHGTKPEVWHKVMLVGHYCYREAGAPQLREVTTDGDQYPHACKDRWGGGGK